MSESEQAPSTSDQREEASAPPAEGAPTRWGVLMRNPKRLIIALVLIVVAISAAAFASATFTSTSANPGNLATTGSLLIENSEDGAILTATGLVPGDSENGTVTISNVGDSAGDFSLTTEDLVDTPPTPPLSGRLDLLIEDITALASPVQKYKGKLNAVGTVQLGRWTSGATHKYRFTLTFPSGTPATDNPYQNAESTVSFVWNAVS